MIAAVLEPNVPCHVVPRSARSASTSPTAGANLNPMPEKPHAILHLRVTRVRCRSRSAVRRDRVHADLSLRERFPDPGR